VLRAAFERASVLLTEARDGYATRNDARGVADVEARLRGIAKSALSPRKEAPDTTLRSS
jgi:hypothetical protein